MLSDFSSGLAAAADRSLAVPLMVYASVCPIEHVAIGTSAGFAVAANARDLSKHASSLGSVALVMRAACSQPKGVAGAFAPDRSSARCRRPKNCWRCSRCLIAG